MNILHNLVLFDMNYYFLLESIHLYNYIVDFSHHDLWYYHIDFFIIRNLASLSVNYLFFVFVLVLSLLQDNTFFNQN
jgi:hypothetical protein